MSETLVKYKERKNTNCVKWDGMQDKFGENDLLPLWVADMDFEVPDCIKSSLKKYIEQGVYGYFSEPSWYNESFIEWEMKNFDYIINREWIRYSPGVVTGVHMLVKAFTKEKDSVMVLTPVYFPFFEAVNNNNRNLVCCELMNVNGVYAVDFNAFEQTIIDENIKLFILCSPHNPVGRVWKREELLKMYDICTKHSVKIVADEIHQDIVMKDYKQLSLASLVNSADVVTITACTKTFNLAAFQNSFVVIPDAKMRMKYDEIALELRILHGTAPGYIAVESGYKNGRPWLDEILVLIERNYNRLLEIVKESGLDIIITPLEGTYLAWIDLRNVLQGRTCKEIVQDQAKIAIDFGDWFGGESFEGFIRMNLATKQENIEEAISRILKYLK